MFCSFDFNSSGSFCSNGRTLPSRLWPHGNVRSRCGSLGSAPWPHLPFPQGPSPVSTTPPPHLILHRPFHLDGTKWDSHPCLNLSRVGFSWLIFPSSGRTMATWAPGSPAQLRPDPPSWIGRCWHASGSCRRTRDKDTEHIKPKGLAAAAVEPLTSTWKCCCFSKGAGVWACPVGWPARCLPSGWDRHAPQSLPGNTSR